MTIKICEKKLEKMRQFAHYNKQGWMWSLLHNEQWPTFTLGNAKAARRLAAK